MIPDAVPAETAKPAGSVGAEGRATRSGEVGAAQSGGGPRSGGPARPLLHPLPRDVEQWREVARNRWVQLGAAFVLGLFIGSGPGGGDPRADLQDAWNQLSAEERTELCIPVGLDASMTPGVVRLAEIRHGAIEVRTVQEFLWEVCGSAPPS